MKLTVSPQKLGMMAFDVLVNDFHRPIVNGRCNRENIADKIVIGILSGKLGPMTEQDVEFICDCVDDLIAEYGDKKGDKNV